MGWNHQLDKQLRSKSSNLDQFFKISTDSVCSVEFSPRNQTWFLRFYHIVWRYSPSIRSDYTGGGGTWFFHKDGSWLDILVGWILCSQDGLDKSFLLKGDSVICLLFFEACRSTMLHNGKKTTCFIIRTYILRYWLITKNPLLLDRWWFQICFIFHPYPGKWSNLTNMFQMGWLKHQLAVWAGPKPFVYRKNTLYIIRLSCWQQLP